MSSDDKHVPQESLPNPRRAVFDRMASVWDGLPRPPELEGLLHRVSEAGAIPVNGRVVDIGTGTGSLLPFLVEQGAGNVIAVDLSVAMLARARQKGGALVLALCADAETLPLSSSTFNVVFCHGVYPHFPRPALVLKDIYRVLRPGGRLVISLPGSRDRINAIHASHPDPILHHDLMPSASDLAADLQSAGWRVLTSLDDPTFYLVVSQKL